MKTPRRSTWLRLFPVLVGALVVASCGVDTESNTFTGPSGPSDGCTGCQDVIAVRVNPPSATMFVDQTLQLTGEAVNSQGQVLVGRTIAWLSSDEDVAKMSSDGVVTGLAIGSATITVSTGGVSGTAAITVTPAPVPAPVPAPGG